MRKYSAILWDVGGTLVDFRGRPWESHRKCLEDCGV
jgi:FMN phosphatase YigB (HAD superfamily)